jgi:signal transduction histidine kinase
MNFSAAETIGRMPVSVTARSTQPWEQRLRLIDRGLPYPMLAVSIALAAGLTASGYGSWQRFEFGVSLAVTATVWTLVLVTLHPAWEQRPKLMGCYYVGRTALAAVLVAVNPWFGLYAFVGYLDVRLLPKRWVPVGLCATALIIAASQMGGFPAANAASIAAYALIGAVNASLAVTFGYATNRVVEQNAERGDMIAELNETNRRLEAALAENTGLHAQLLAQARQAGVLDERQRLAGEIHDTLAQGLIGIVTQLEAAEQSRHTADESQRHIDQAQALARESLNEARRSVRALRPEQLDDLQLAEAVAALAQSWSQRSGVAVHAETTGECRSLSPDVEATLFRVAQEALANVAKHAEASKVWLTLSYLDDVVLLDIRDDGIGFDPAASGHDGYGLEGMRRRLRRVGGTLEVESAPGEGTAINAGVPVGR